MSNRKITDMVALTAPASDDVLPIVDISEAAAVDKNKKISIEELFKGVPDGTAAAPSIAFESDDDSGIFLAGTNTVGLSTNGAQRVTVDSSGNVGIGTSSPSNMLHINGASPAIRLSDTGANGSAFSMIEDNNGLLKLRNDAGNSGTGSGIAFDVDASERMRIDSSGRLLVGTTTANGNMTVNMGTDKNISFTGGVSEVGSVPALQATNTSGSSLASMGFRATDLRFATGSAERLRIDSSGNLGLGTSSPGQLLHLNSSASTAIQISDGTNNQFISSIKTAGNFANGSTAGDILIRGQSGFAVSPNNGSSVALRVDSSGNITATGSATFASTVLANGTAASPSLRFTSQTNMGLFKAASGGLGFATAGSQKMEIDSSGNVGIGENAPANLLHVKASDTGITPHASAQIVLERSGTNYLQLLTANTGTQGILFGDADDNDRGKVAYDHSNDSMRFEVAAGERLRIDASGNCGIGTTSADRTLHVRKDDAAAVKFGGENGGDYAIEIGQLGSSSSPGFNATGGSSMLFKMGGTEAMRIDSSGNLGLGTSSPAANAKLDVNGSVNISPNTAGKETFRFTTNAVDDGRLLIKSNTTTKVDIQANGASYFNGGNVGIGTAAPAYTLHVGDGSAQATQRIDSNATALLSLKGGTSSECRIEFGDSGDDDIGKIYYDNSTNSMEFSTNASERMRIDSSGRLLFGTSTNLSSADGVQIYNSSPFLIGCKADNNPAQGAILMGMSGFSQSGTVFASAAFVRCESGGSTSSGNHPGQIVFGTTATGTSSTERMRIDSGGLLIKMGDSNSARILPQTDNAGYLGEASHRWQAVYAVNGTIQTSDERQKTAIKTSELGADFIRSLRPVSYKWKIGGYTSTWDDENNETITPNPGVRTHYGFIAQEVKQACEDTDFGGWLQEDLEDPESMQSLRLHEFISPIVKALQEALDEIENLKQRLTDAGIA